jgi:hypothetical protein
MRLHLVAAPALFLVAWLGSSAPASADITAFLGLAGGPSTRTAKGLAVGFGVLFAGVEFEYADIGSDADKGAPGIKTGMVNGLLQTPVPIHGFQLYATAGAGIYHHDLQGLTETNVVVNVGGGFKKSLVGPLRARVDYRVLRFAGSPIANDVVHRFCVGANLTF